MTLINLIIAILLPPLAVYLQLGFSLQFWINIVLTILGYFPGVLHALWILYRF